MIASDQLPAYKDVEWIYEIISNSKTGIDVDRWDYMNRDPKMVGM
jgi:HD superfamily phosphohydrolase